MIGRSQSCADLGSWLSGSGAGLEDPARWAGVVIALLGAAAANPDATAHTISRVWGYVLDRGRRFRGWLARFMPFLRRDGVMHAGSAHVNLSDGVGVLHARGITPMVSSSTVEEKIEVLDKRTLRLHDEVGELQVRLGKSEGKLRQEIASTASELRHEIAQTRTAIEELNQQSIRSDASALPIIVLGVVISGMSPDARSVPMWLGLLVLFVLGAISVWRGVRIFSAWRAGRRAIL